MKHNIFKVVGVHLAMGDFAAGGRDQAANLFGDVGDTFHSVVQKIDLAAPVKLAQDDFADKLVVVFFDIGFDRHAAFRRVVNQRHIPDARQRHMKRARDRRRRHGQHIHVLFHLLDALFVRDPKALLFVHNQKAQAVKFDVF